MRNCSALRAAARSGWLASAKTTEIWPHALLERIATSAACYRTSRPCLGRGPSVQPPSSQILARNDVLIGSVNDELPARAWQWRPSEPMRKRASLSGMWLAENKTNGSSGLDFMHACMMSSVHACQQSRCSDNDERWWSSNGDELAARRVSPLRLRGWPS